jgi:hypothetical protein
MRRAGSTVLLGSALESSLLESADEALELGSLSLPALTPNCACASDT